MIDAVTLRGRGAYLPGADALVVADLHVGQDAASNVQVHLGEDDAMVERLASLIERVDPAEVVVAGDFLHAFDAVPADVPATVEAIRARVREADADLVVTPGNHDSLLSAVYDGRAPGQYRLADGATVVCHGHEAPEADAERYVIGHDHPAIEIEGHKRPCYLVGTHDGADVLVLPAFTELAAGATVNRMRAGDFQSPLIDAAGRFRPIVRDEASDETLEFPALGQLRRFL